MRTFFLLLLAVTLLIACTNVVLAESSTRSIAAVDSEVDTQRVLKSTQTLEDDEDDNSTDDDDEEERGLGDMLRGYKLRSAANKEMKAITKAEKAAQKAAKREEEAQKLLANALAKDVSPAKMYKTLGLSKLKGTNVEKSPNYKYYEQYLQDFQAKWGGAAR